MPSTAPPVAAVAARVQERLRADGVDPTRDRERAARLTRGEIRAHNDAACARDVLAHLVGYGPLQPYLDDPTVEEVWINAPDRVFLARDGRTERAPVTLTETAVQELGGGPRGRRWSAPQGQTHIQTGGVLDAGCGSGFALRVARGRRAAAPSALVLRA